MRTGRVRHRVTLQSATEARDGHGEPIKTWTDEATVWAEVAPLLGKELEAVHQIVAEATVRVLIRYRGDVDANWRIVFGSRTLEIVAPPIDAETRGIQLLIYCREIL